MAKQFTENDVEDSGSEFPRIYCDASDLIEAPTSWQKAGLQETASGYGMRLNTGRKISFNGREYRLYATCFSNVASVWFVTMGRKIYVS